jgi:hypothetical protein
LRPIRGVLGGEVEGEVEEVDGAVDVGCLVEKNADPAAFGKDVMGFGAAGGDQFIADFLRERNIDQAIAVDVADFASREVVFRAAETMGLGCDAGPGLNSGIDFLFRAVDWHFIPPARLPYWMRRTRFANVRPKTPVSFAAFSPHGEFSDHSVTPKTG